ncbi:MAG: ATP-binding protein [Gammaproteobacteria bacterium]
MNHIPIGYTDSMMLHSVRSLKSLLSIHEIAFLFLVAVTGLLGSLSTYFWQQTSTESVRINKLIYVTEQIRSELFAQMEKVMRARLMEDPKALDLYAEYSRGIDKHFNRLRQESASRREDDAIQAMQRSYRELQKDMNNIFNDPYAMNYFVRLKILNPSFAEHMVGKFENSYHHFKSMLEEEHKQLDKTIGHWTQYAPVLIPVFFLLAVALVLFSRHILRIKFMQPMATVMQGASVISHGRLQHRIPEQGVKEVSEIAGSINRMAKDLASSRDALIESEKQAALGTLVPVVAHNIRNPLASIRATVQVLEDITDADEIRESRHAIIDTIDRLNRWVNALVSYLHPLKPDIKRIRASAMLEATLTLLKPKLEAKNIRLERKNWQHDMELSVDPDLMEQALYGLLVNAIEASPESGLLLICFEREKENFLIRMIDNGPGLPFEPQAGNLEPGPSSKRFGTGLGIPVAFKICQTHGWELKFKRNEHTTGTEAIVSAPIEPVDIHKP